MTTVTPFLWFEKDGYEAALFYIAVFGDKGKIISRNILSETPSGTVEIINLELAGQPLTIMQAGPYKKLNEAFSLVISTDGQEETDHYWNSLSAVAESEQCGWLKDKYGLTWQVVPFQLQEFLGGPDKEGTKRAMQAMLQMKKIIISDLETAYNG